MNGLNGKVRRKLQYQRGNVVHLTKEATTVGHRFHFQNFTSCNYPIETCADFAQSTFALKRRIESGGQLRPRRIRLLHDYSQDRADDNCSGLASRNSW